jgi:hypothetical protein
MSMTNANSRRNLSTRITSLHKFLYAGLLALSSLSVLSSSASAQDIAYGRFSLAHDVHWQNAIVPAGEYRFSVEGDGPSSVLKLSKLDGRRAGFLLVAHDTDEAGAGPSRLMLENTNAGKYVSAMQLPEFGVTLHFTVPAAAEKQLARAETSATAGVQ